MVRRWSFEASEQSQPDLWLGAVTNPDADHVLVSDDPDLAFVLDHLPGAGIDTCADVVRVGVHAIRYKVEVDSRPKGSRGEHTSAFLILTESQLATLVGVQELPHGGLLRHALHHAVETHKSWTSTGIDPETGALNVITCLLLDPEGDGATEQHEVEARLFPNGFEIHSGLATGLEADQAGRCSLRITLDPQRPCAHPVLAAFDTPSPPTDLARVMSQRGAEIHVDVDDDGLADETVSVGHVSRSFEPGTSVRVARDESSGNWYLVDPGQYVGEEFEPELVAVADYNGTWPMLEALEDGATGLGSPTPGCESIRAHEGDVLVALRSGDAGQLRWLVLSSPLDHLARMIRSTHG